MEEKIIKEILLEVGVPIHYLGFKYATTLVKHVLTEDVTKITVLYSIVARKHKSTASKVERAIRSALEKSKANEYFNIGHKIRNKEFIELVKFKALEKLSVKQEILS